MPEQVSSAVPPDPTPMPLPAAAISTPSPPAIAPAQSAPAAQSTANRAFFVSMGALVISLVGLCIQWNQWAINQRAQDRQSGKLRAKFVFVEKSTDQVLAEVLRTFKPDPNVKPGDKITYDLSAPTNRPAFQMDNLEDLIRWAPTIEIKNTGEEIIDGIRVEVFWSDAAAIGDGVKQIKPDPIVVSDVAVRETSSFGKIMPNKSASIHLLPVLLESLLQSRLPMYKDKDHFTIFHVRVLCRPFGFTTYDTMEANADMKLAFQWRPPAFAAEEKRCQEVIKGMLRVSLEP
jgi:hypothetical protein